MTTIKFTYEEYNRLYKTLFPFTDPKNKSGRPLFAGVTLKYISHDTVLAYAIDGYSWVSNVFKAEVSNEFEPFAMQLLKPETKADYIVERGEYGKTLLECDDTTHDVTLEGNIVNLDEIEKNDKERVTTISLSYTLLKQLLDSCGVDKKDIVTLDFYGMLKPVRFKCNKSHASGGILPIRLQ